MQLGTRRAVSWVETVQGADPAAEKQAKRKAATVAELCDAYWEDAKAGRVMTRRRTPKKASTCIVRQGADRQAHQAAARPDEGCSRHGPRTLKASCGAWRRARTAGRVKTGKKRGLSNVRGGAGTATRTVGLLGAIFTYAVVRQGIRPDNPVHGVMRYAGWPAGAAALPMMNTPSARRRAA